MIDVSENNHRSNLFSYRGIVWNGLLNHESEYANYLFFEVSTQFNHLILLQNPNRYSDNQHEVYKIIKSLHDNGIGYRRIAKILNDRGMKTDGSHVWKNTNVFSVLKRYRQRQENMKFRNTRYPIVRGKMWVEFTRKI